jgi:hypothetical protein
MSRKDPGRISHEDIKTLRRVTAWLTKIGRLDELQQVVTNDVADIADEALTSRAVVNIRLLNKGASPSEKKRAAARESLIKARQKRFGRAALEWTPAEDALLRELWGATETSSDEIAERLDRPMRACQDRASTLGVRRMVDYHPARLTPLGRARLVKSRRQAAEASARRNQEMESAYQD